jgi:hypothetical protein
MAGKFKEKKRRSNYLALSTDKSYFGRNQSDSNKQFSVTENVFVNRKSDYYRYQLCPSSRRLVPTFVRYVSGITFIRYLSGITFIIVQ